MTLRRLGFDVGGTKCLAVVLDAAGHVADSRRRPTPQGENELVATLAALADDLGVETASLDRVGVGVPGLIGGGVIHASPHLPRLIRFDIGAALHARLGCAVTVDNDATCAALAEWRLGAGRGADDMVMVTMGTGIGGGLIVGGRLQHGVNGFAGEFGHMMVDPHGPPCPCGKRGCWERYASGTGLARLARDAAAGGRLAQAGGEIATIRGEDVQRWARSGDEQALAVIAEFARWVGIGLATLANTLDPELFVLGGGLASSADLFLGPVGDALVESLYASDHRRPPRVEAAQLGEQAGAIGAALLAADHTRPMGA